MDKSYILFDDWATRSDGLFNARKLAYVACIICVTLLLIISTIGVFFEWGMIVMLVISLIVIISLILEWLKVKHNHLIIRENQIEITNRFHKNTVYQIKINNIRLELRHAFDRRSGGIIMKFFDLDGNLICKYEDMINHPAPYGATPSDWEKSLWALGIDIRDPQNIIENK